jgi:hypothetical protein
MADVHTDYRGYVIIHPEIRLDTSGWTVNLSSNSRSLIARLEQPCMVFTDGHSLDGAIAKAKRYIDGVLGTAGLIGAVA